MPITTIHEKLLNLSQFCEIAADARKIFLSLKKTFHLVSRDVSLFPTQLPDSVMNIIGRYEPQLWEGPLSYPLRDVHMRNYHAQKLAEEIGEEYGKERPYLQGLGSGLNDFMLEATEHDQIIFYSYLKRYFNKHFSRKSDASGYSECGKKYLSVRRFFWEFLSPEIPTLVIDDQPTSGFLGYLTKNELPNLEQLIMHNSVTEQELRKIIDHAKMPRLQECRLCERGLSAGVLEEFGQRFNLNYLCNGKFEKKRTPLDEDENKDEVAC